MKCQTILCKKIPHKRISLHFLSSIGMDTGTSARALAEFACLHGIGFTRILIGTALTGITFIGTAFDGVSFRFGASCLFHSIVNYLMLSTESSPELVRCASLDRPKNDDRHEVIALARCNLVNLHYDLLFDLLTTRTNTHFLRRVSQRHCRWNVLTELNRDEHVQVFHVDYSLLGCVDRPIRRDHCRGKSRHLDCFKFL